MNSRIQLAYYALWIAHPVLQTGLAVMMLWRKLHRKFPVFFAYLISQILTFAVVFSARSTGNYELYFYSYWISAAVNLSLGFLVIHEIFVDVFRPYHTLRDLGTVLFKWAGMVMLLVACVVAAASPSSDQGPLVQAVLTAQRCIRVTQCGLVLFLLIFSKYLGVSWKQRSFGIVLGFGGFAVVELFVVALRAGSYVSELTTALINMCAYNLFILVWAGYMWVKVSERGPSANLLASQRWDESLTDIQHPSDADSLIPMFEGMVDRALSRAPETSPTSPRGQVAKLLVRPDPGQKKTGK